MLTKPMEDLRTAVLIGFESSGKSALFRGFTGQNAGEETNFRGSTIRARKELGWTFASSLAGKQMVTSIVSAGIIMLLVGR